MSSDVCHIFGFPHVFATFEANIRYYELLVCIYTPRSITQIRAVNIPQLARITKQTSAARVRRVK